MNLMLLAASVIASAHSILNEGGLNSTESPGTTGLKVASDRPKVFSSNGFVNTDDDAQGPNLLFNYPLDAEDSPPAGRHSGRGHWPDEMDSDSFDPYSCKVRVNRRYIDCFEASSDYNRKLHEMKHFSRQLPDVPTDSLDACVPTRNKRGVVAILDTCFRPEFHVRKPFQMLNSKGQMRYIVQEPPQLKQCIQEASCRFAGPVCSALAYAFNIPSCVPKICLKTLLAFDPQLPNAGPFPDSFPVKCGCNCFGDAPSQSTVPVWKPEGSSGPWLGHTPQNPAIHPGNKPFDSHDSQGDYRPVGGGFGDYNKPFGGYRPLGGHAAYSNTRYLPSFATHINKMLAQSSGDGVHKAMMQSSGRLGVEYIHQKVKS